ncbi:hypothetical protein H2198_006221 [Neophaeococcomyces mojaviensis]|uniref:Uncharacterized protein n=1 Tax=Neophaeococcomyces mojaviensis TaxID=3383035 RepID=A0ACC3A3I7_9EURO|nr:hypothetical protein H2198_006221 [Knufia sp. JES_112]
MTQQSAPLSNVANENENENAEIIELYFTLSTQASRLLRELDDFQDYISTKYPDSDVFLARFRREVRQEAKMLRDRGKCIPPTIWARYAGDSRVEDKHYPQHASAELFGDVLSPDDGKEGNKIEIDEKECNGGVGTCLAFEERVDNGDGADGVSDDLGLRGLHNVRSSNITSYVAIWEVAKRNEGLVSLKKKVKYPALTRVSSRKKKKVPKETATIDIIAGHGTKWIKVWTKSQRWLEMDMAKEGLVDLGEDLSIIDEDEDTSSGVSQILQGQDRDGLNDLKLVRMAREYVAASKTSRINHKHPKVHFVLPKIHRSRSRDVDVVLAAIERLGVVVVCFGEIEPAEGSILAESIGGLFERMLGHPEPPSYPNGHALNLDCTVLIALVSDISHSQLRSEEAPNGVEIPSHYHGQSRCDVYDQFQADKCRPLLISDIYPILSGKQLICTSTAAEHLRKIVRLMGTETEARRAEILLEDMKADRARAEWTNISVHEMPGSVQLPLEIVNFDLGQALSDIQQQSQRGVDHADFEVAHRLSKLEERQLSGLNKAVFISGWSRRIRTFTLNRVVSGFIDRTIDAILDDIEEQRTPGGFNGPVVFDGPYMKVCARERSLIGSEKTCRNK